MKRKMRKTILGVVVLVALMSTMADAAWYRVDPYLSASIHYVPILKDKATGYTMITNPNDFSTAACSTTVYAYNKSGSYASGSASATGAAAVEGWSVGHATASIRALVRASGTHKAKSDATNNSWIYKYTSLTK